MDDSAQVPSAQQAADDQAKITQNPVPTLASDMEEFEEKQKDWQAMYDAGGHFKEQVELAKREWRKEAPAMKEIPTEPEIEKEIEAEGYIERVEKDPELFKALADDYVKQVGMTTPAAQNPKVKLPLSDDQIKLGLHHKVWEAIRWLAEWCLRQVKMLR